LALVACGPSIPGEPTLGDVEAHEVLAEHCGSTDPIRLLSLATNELAVGPAPSPNGWVFGIGVYDREITQTTPIVSTNPEDLPQRVSSRIVWVDECGTDVRVVAEDAITFRAPSGDEPWIACANRNVLAFDPEVEHAGQWHPGLQCPQDAIGDAFLAKTWDDPEVLVRARLPVEGPAEITPLTTLHDTWPMRRIEGSDRYILLTDTYELLELDARTGAMTMLRSNAYRFDISDDGRFVLWEQAVWPPPPRLLWDRQTGQERPQVPSEWEGEPVIEDLDGNVASAEHSDRELTQLTLLPSGTELLLEGRWRGVAQLGETYVLEKDTDPSSTSLMGKSLAIVDPGSDVPRPIPHGTLKGWWVYDDRLWTLGVVDDADPSRLGLLELAGPDFTPRVVATDIWYPMRLADGRLLTVLDRNSEDLYGTLVVVDAEGVRMEIDHDVRVDMTDIAPLANDMVHYEVRDPDHTRTGMWAAQIAPLVEP
jgi:hypothetical protein